MNPEDAPLLAPQTFEMVMLSQAMGRLIGRGQTVDRLFRPTRMVNGKVLPCEEHWAISGTLRWCANHFARARRMLPQQP